MLDVTDIFVLYLYSLKLSKKRGDCVCDSSCSMGDCFVANADYCKDCWYSGSFFVCIGWLVLCRANFVIGLFFKYSKTIFAIKFRFNGSRKFKNHTDNCVDGVGIYVLPSTAIYPFLPRFVDCQSICFFIVFKGLSLCQVKWWRQLVTLSTIYKA